MSYSVYGVLADWWAARTGAASTEQLLRVSGRYSDAEWLARDMSVEGLDGGAVEYWASAGGHTEIRQCGTDRVRHRVDGELIAAYVDGKRFTAEQWATRTPPCPVCGSAEADCRPGCPAVPPREAG